MFSNFKNGLMTTLLVLTTSLIACAKPNYQNATPLANENNYTLKNCELYFNNEKLCVDLTWEKQQSDSETGSFFLKFYRLETPTEFVDPQFSPWVVLWMPSMGHGAGPVKVEKISIGEYRVLNVYFVMPGQWDLRLQLKDGAKVVEQIIKSVTI